MPRTYDREFKMEAFRLASIIPRVGVKKISKGNTKVLKHVGKDKAKVPVQKNLL